MMSDVRALLLTDVVDSTKLSERLGDAAMAQVWAAHDRVARDLLPQWRGREIDKTDGMLLLFEQACDAVAYALHYHRALAALPVALKARAGLHVGPVILRENHAEDVARGAKPLEVDGLAKPTAARVMSVAHGGQTLLTPEANAALGETPLARQSHGFWVMKGLAEPIELFEVGEDATSFAPPPDGEKVYRVVRLGDRWLPVRQVPNNLPELPTSFVGRERELDEIKALLHRARLVTLLGMGGLGKTRLSLQAALELRAEYPDGIWFLDLSSLRDPAHVLGEAARVLGVREEPGRPLQQTLAEQLKPRRLLIVMDNCEHLIQACASLAHALLQAAPELRLMASSREALHVPGEQAYPILPLPLPAPGDSFERVSASTAVRLFVARAQAQKPSYELSEAEAPAVVELVRRLEGIPLALELAAARVRLLSVTDINKRLGDRYKLLTGGDRVLQERQQTLRALVDWSYELLQESEQLLFRRLGVFVDGFDLPAAEQICGLEPLEDFEVLDLMGSLVEKSLLLTEERNDGTRYRMLETLREYAVDKLARSDEQQRLEQSHCQFFFELAKQARNGMRGADQGVWLDRLDAEHGNLRVAHGTAQRDAGVVDPLITVKLAVALQNFWILRGYASEGRVAVQASLQLPVVRATPVAHAHALYVAATLAYSQSDYAAALAALGECLQLRRELGNPADIAATLSTIAMARLGVGQGQTARAALLEALDLVRQVGDATGEAIVRLQLGQVDFHLGDENAARQDLELALEQARAVRHPETEAEVELTLGMLHARGGDWYQAELAFSDSLSLCTRSGDRRGAASALWWLGHADLRAGRLDSACARLSGSLQAFAGFEMREQLLACLEDHARLAQALGRLELAVRLAAGASGLRERAGLIRSDHAEEMWRETLEQLRAALPGDRYQSCWEGGFALGTQDVLRNAQDVTAASA